MLGETGESVVSSLPDRGMHEVFDLAAVPTLAFASIILIPSGLVDSSFTMDIETRGFRLVNPVALGVSIDTGVLPLEPDYRRS